MNGRLHVDSLALDVAAAASGAPDYRRTLERKAGMAIYARYPALLAVPTYNSCLARVRVDSSREHPQQPSGDHYDKRGQIHPDDESPNTS